MAREPITLTLYGPDNEVTKQVSRAIVPWGILKQALRLSKAVDFENADEDTIDELTNFIVALFGGSVTGPEVEKGADLEEMIAVFQQVMGKAAAILPSNPTKPA